MSTKQDRISVRHSKYIDLFTSRKAWRWANGAWGSINQRTVNGVYANSPAVLRNKQMQSYLQKGIQVEFSKMEFCQWAAKQESLIDSMYASGETPNVDRINDQGHYTLENIQLLTSTANRAKQRDLNGYSPTSRRATALYKTVCNRRSYLRSMEGLPVKEQPFDALILAYKPRLVCKIIEQSRQEMQDDILDYQIGPCSLYMGDVA